MENKNLIINPKPPKGEDGYRTFSIRVKKEIVKGLEEVCAHSGFSRNELIGVFLAYGLKNCKVEKSEKKE